LPSGAPYLSLSLTSALAAKGGPTITCAFPEAKAAEECVGVVSSSATGREVFQFLGVTSPKNNVVRVEGVDQSGYSKRDISLPFFFA
jgi:hypothetical protein